MNPRILEIQERLNRVSDSPEKADLLIELAGETRSFDPQQALQLCREALTLSETLQYNKGRADSLRMLAICHERLSNYQEALGQAFEALRLFHDQGDAMGINRVLNVIGLVYLRLGDYVKSLEFYFQVLKSAPFPEDRLLEAFVLNNIGLVYQNMENHQSALEYFFKGLRLLEELGEEKYLGDAFGNIGSIYRKMGEQEHALEYLQKALAIRQKFDDTFGQAHSWNNLGNVYLAMDDHPRALECWEKSLQLSTETGDQATQMYSQINIASLMIKENQGDLAIGLLKRALAIAEEIKARHNLPVIYQNLSQAYEQVVDFDQAYEYYRKYHEVEKEVLNQQVEEKVKGLQISYEVDKAKREAEIYRLQNIDLAKAYKDLEALAGSYDKLSQANRELQELDKLKTEFIANISHELKTPLTAISGYVDFVAGGSPGPLTEGQRKVVNSMGSNLKRLTRQIKDLLDFTAIEAGHFSVEPKPFNLRGLIDEVMGNHQGDADKKRVALAAAADRGLCVLADRERIFQVLENLVANAIKFTDRGGIEIAAQQKGDAVEVSVSDTGIGIPEESIPMIFERFQQLDGSATRRYGGVGLGLAIVKSILEAHHSQIGVRSTPGAGTTFSFLLPAA